MKYFLIFLLFTSPVFAEGSKNNLKKVSKKVEKRKGYCSPLDKMMKKCKTEETDSDKKIVNKAQAKAKEVSKKVEKRKDYCSPLDKMMNKCKGQKK